VSDEIVDSTAVDSTAGDRPVLEMVNVSLTLGEGARRVDALLDISLEVHAKELVAVTGRSGSGKSSLLNAAGGLIPASAGSVVVEGEDLSALTARRRSALRRRSVGYVFQDLNLVSSLTAIENVSLPLELDGTSLAKARRQAEAALERVGVAHGAERFPDELSGGEQQRVALARGIVGERRLLLADEPTGALDELTAERVMSIVRGLCDDGAAAVMVTHDQSLAGWADRVVRLRDGRVEAVTTRPTITPELINELS